MVFVHICSSSSAWALLFCVHHRLTLIFVYVFVFCSCVQRVAWYVISLSLGLHVLTSFLFTSLCLVLAYGSVQLARYIISLSRPYIIDFILAYVVLAYSRVAWYVISLSLGLHVLTSFLFTSLCLVLAYGSVQLARHIISPGLTSLTSFLRT
jgi:hypothetical protein